MIIAIVIFSILALIVIVVNWSSWVWRGVWIVTLGLALFFVPLAYRLVVPILLILMLATIQTIYRMGTDEDSE